MTTIELFVNSLVKIPCLNYNKIPNYKKMKGGKFMELFDKLYDENEKTSVRFVGFTTKNVRYDFGIVYTNMFFGKPLVICMQTGKSTLLDSKDIENLEYLQKIFRIDTLKEASDLAEFFKESLPTIPFETQYE